MTLSFKKLIMVKMRQFQQMKLNKNLIQIFFAGRWAKATDRQRELLLVVAHLDCSDEFKVLEVVEKSKELLDNPFGRNNVNQMLNTLISQGLIFRNRHGKYSFAVPLLDRYIKREYENRV